VSESGACCTVYSLTIHYFRYDHETIVIISVLGVGG